MNKLLTLLGELLGKPNSGEWVKQKDLVAGSDFLGAVANVDPRLQEAGMVAKIKDVVQSPECQADQISRPSTSQYVGAVTLSKWLSTLHAECVRIAAEE